MLSVVFFHAGLGVTGGYVGVDVFFVISGFLITTLIIKDLENGTFSLGVFWERRVRRIMPAMFVVVVATLIAGGFLLLPFDYVQLGRSAAWQAFSGSNFHFWANTGYFESYAEEQPLLHTWSLAVEEQFYLVVPLLLLGFVGIRSPRRNHIMLLFFAVGIVISLAVSIDGVARHPAAAFYLLPTRAWELLCGAAVAVFPVSWVPHSRLSRELFSVIGLTAILIPCFLYTKTTPFPGLAAVSPCLGAAIFIWASGTSRQRPEAANPLVAKLLSLRPIVFIGLISYSLYLWHWPLFAFSTYWALQPKSLAYSLTLVATSFGLAVITWWCVETPFRRRVVCISRKSIFAFCCIGITLIVTFASVIIFGKGLPRRLPAQAIEYANAKDDRGNNRELTAADVLGERLVRLGNPDPATPITTLLWGDSHAMAAAPAFDALLRARGLSGLQVTASATAPVLDAYWSSEFTSRREVKAFNDAVFAYITRQRIRNVILVARWEYYSDARGDITLDVALGSTIRRLAEIGTRAYVMLQVPSHTFNVPRALAATKIFNRDLTASLLVGVERNGMASNDRMITESVELAGGRILNPRRCFWDSANLHLLVEKNGKSLYADDHHLSATGARLALLPCLELDL